MLFVNVLAEMCSWLGRKNNYAVGHLHLIDLAFSKFSFHVLQAQPHPVLVPLLDHKYVREKSQITQVLKKGRRFLSSNYDVVFLMYFNGLITNLEWNSVRKIAVEIRIASVFCTL